MRTRLLHRYVARLRAWGARWQRRRQRRIDRTVLFPSLRRMQRTEIQGTTAIRWHVELDSAWKYPSEWEGEGIETPPRKETA